MCLSNNFGIFDKSYKLLLETIQEFNEIEKVVLFGSRAMGNYKEGSDIDLAIYGEKINFETIARLSGKLNQQLPIPYSFDIVDYNKIETNELKQHINNKGKLLFIR